MICEGFIVLQEAQVHCTMATKHSLNLWNEKKVNPQDVPNFLGRYYLLTANVQFSGAILALLLVRPYPVLYLPYLHVAFQVIPRYAELAIPSDHQTS